MNDESVKMNINSDDVINNLNKYSFMTKVLFIICMVILVFGILLCISIKNIKGMLFSIPFVIIMLIICSLQHIKGKNNLKDIDLNEIKKELNNHCIYYPTFKTYFTDNYIISNYYYASVIKYDDIVYMHQVKKHYYIFNVWTDLVLELKNKKRIFIRYGKDIDSVIVSHNPFIFLGNSIEKIRYKDWLIEKNTNTK